MTVVDAGAIQPADDLLGHQTASRMSRPAVADGPEGVFTERFWYMGCGVPAGDFVFGAGLGYYPNRGVMDGYAGVTVGGVQHVFQASRRLGANPLETRIGPLRITVGEGMRSHRIELGSNDSGLTLDLDYHAAFEPNDEGLDRLMKRDRVAGELSRFVQFGHYTGWLEVRGKRFEFDRSNPLWGARDRSWGLRVEARADESHPPVTQFKPLLFTWVSAQFAESGIHFFLKETAPAKPRFFMGDEVHGLETGKPRRIIARVDHEIEWFDDPHSQHIRSGRFTLHFADGERKLLEFRALPGRFYLKAGLYGGYRGWFQGDDKGPLHVQHHAWDHANPETRRELRTVAEQIMEFRIGSSVGYGTIQAGVAAGYPKYPEVHHLPTL